MIMKDMTSSAIALCMACAAVAVAGCNRNSVEDPISDDFMRCAELVKNCNVPAPANVRYAAFKKTFDDISVISNVTLKIEKAKQFAKLVDGIDLKLKKGDYADFADRVSRYKALFDWTVGSLFDARVEGTYVFQHLVNGMDRYREACFAIPIGARAATESVDAYEKKCRTICGLAAEYEYAMMLLDKAERCHLQSLPPELHVKYREWKRTIPSYPKAKDVREMIRELQVRK